MSIVSATPRSTNGDRSLVAYSLLGCADLMDGLRQWRLCYLLATADMRRRFARSKLGQLWIMLSGAILVIALGAVWSFLWHQPIHDMLPYVAVSMMTWQLISGVVIESTTALPSSSNYFLNQYTSTSTIVYAVIYRNGCTYLLNMIFPLLICLFFDVSFTSYALLCIPGAVLLFVTFIWISFMTAILCARFRDIVQIVSSVMQIIFFVTPVLWKPELLPSEVSWIAELNPFAAMLSVVRDPLLGRPVSGIVWAAAFVLAFGGLIVTLPFFGRYRRRVVYWL
ncbi:lipopolysaccharide transport system permease protein [Rhizobiales bacterium GAS113]|nr:lipopolysaccharide transport system permease protein [Rhizobiales bacterium GAS113]SED42380.1 lipopolysaccharide transport system permease protein [Rhizobiales bacterium GAS188]